MSWDILYNRQFVRVNDMVIPMILSGSNNCYEATGYGRKRARDWWRHTYHLEGDALGIKPEDLEKKLDNELENYAERYKDEADKEKVSKSWGYYTAIRIRTSMSSTFGQYKAFYMNGCKEAMTVEQLVEHGVHMSVGVYRYEDKDILSKGLEILPTVTISTTQELIETYERYSAYYKNNNVIVGFHNSYAVERMIKKLRAKPKKYEYVEVKKFYVLKSNDGGSTYFLKGLKRGYKYAYSETGAKKFLTEKKAIAFWKRMKYKDYFNVTLCINENSTYVKV